MNNFKKLQIDEKTQKILIDGQKQVLQGHMSSQRGNLGVLHRYFREPTYFYVNFMLRKKRMPSRSELEGREVMDEISVLNVINELDAVFEQVDDIQAPLIVYRAVALSSIDQYENLTQFHSTSFDIDFAKNMLHGRSCCILKITVPSSVRSLFTGNQLNEVILNRNTNIFIDNNSTNDMYYNGTKVVNAVAVSETFVSIDNFVAEIREQEDHIRGTFELRRKQLDNNMSQIDEILTSLMDDIQMEDVDTEKYMLDLKLSNEQLDKLIKMTTDDDSIKDIKRNFNLLYSCHLK
jgi:hypothetical protein